MKYVILMIFCLTVTINSSATYGERVFIALVPSFIWFMAEVISELKNIREGVNKR